jgi:integrase
MSASTIKHAYHVLKGSLDKAVLAGVIPRSPCTGIMLPKGQKKPPVVYDEAQIKQLIEAAKGTEMELIIDIELCLGLRRGELLGLQWDNIDFEKNQLHVVRNRVVVDGKSMVKDPKTESSRRTVDVPVQLIQKLRQHKTKCLANRLRMGQAYTVTDYVIVHPDGKPIYPEYVSQMFTKLQNKAGLPKCRFHDLRHLCASIMLMQGVNVKVAQEHLGHKDISTTMNIYSHVLPSVAKEAAQKIGALVYDVG